MLFQIIAKAPTAYQLNSLRAFGMPYQPNGNGSYTAFAEFESNQTATDYLNARAEQYNDADPEGTPQRLAAMKADIANGSLTLDGVTAYVVKAE